MAQTIGAGKDEVLLNALAVQSLKRPASYMYMFPESTHARRSMWDAINPHTGKKRIIETFGPILAKDPNNTDMRLDLANGTNITFFGSDNYDRAVGAGLAGIVSSEHALSHPSAYAFFSPMLRENGGFFWAISTPRGRNHFKSLIEYASKSDRWFSEILSIGDTNALPQHVIDEAREEYVGMYGLDAGEAFFNQEYYVDFNAAILGAFYARELANVRAEGRVTDECVADPTLPVHTAWDIGVSDDTSIWFFQVVGTQVFVFDCYSSNGAGVEHYAEILEQKFKENAWQKGIDYVPHDARVKEWGSGKTRVETMLSLGLSPQVVPNVKFLDGINAVRRTLPSAVFNPACEEGLSSLEQYRREWDDEKKTFKANHLHDWTSHLADSFRYLSVSWQLTKPAPKPIIYPNAPSPYHVQIKPPTRGRRSEF